jgi:hypothetical protein
MGEGAMTPDERSEARRLCEAATKGPLDIVISPPEPHPLITVVAGTQPVCDLYRGWDKSREQVRADAEFIVLARTALPKSLDEIDRLEQRLTELEPVDLANLLDRLRYIAEQRGHFASCTPEHCACGLATTLHDAHAAIVALGGQHATQG